MTMADDRPGFAVDIDNVLCRAEYEVQRLYREISGSPWPRGCYGSAGGLDNSDLDRSLKEEIFSRFHEESIPRLPVAPSAKLVLTWLRRRYRILVITARRPYSRPQTLQWLTDHGLPFDALYHTEEKDQVRDGIVAAIDDHPQHIHAYLNQGIRVFVMDQPWNRIDLSPSAIRVSGWDALWHWLQVRSLNRRSRQISESPSPTCLLAPVKSLGAPLQT